MPAGALLRQLTVQATAAQHGLVNIIVKRTSSRYELGKRARSWIDTPLRHTLRSSTEAGHPDRGGAPGTRGALLLGVPSSDGLRYIGNVGSGFTDAVLADLFPGSPPSAG